MPKQTFLNLPEAKRETIIDVAIDEFAERGYENASISQMVARAGIAKGSFYQYFEEKEDLYAYVLDYALVSQKIRMSDEEAPKLEGVTIPEFLRMLIKRMMSEFSSKPKVIKMGLDFLKNRNGPVGKRIMERYKHISDNYFQNFIQAEKGRNEIDENVDDDMLGHMLMGAANELVNLMLTDRYSTISEEYIDKWVDRLEYILTNGIYKNTTHGQ